MAGRPITSIPPLSARDTFCFGMFTAIAREVVDLWPRKGACASSSTLLRLLWLVLRVGQSPMHALPRDAIAHQPVIHRLPKQWARRHGGPSCNPTINRQVYLSVGPVRQPNHQRVTPWGVQYRDLRQFRGRSSQACVVAGPQVRCCGLRPCRGQRLSGRLPHLAAGSSWWPRGRGGQLTARSGRTGKRRGRRRSATAALLQCWSGPLPQPRSSSSSSWGPLSW